VTNDSDRLATRVIDVLRAADEPLSVGRIQRRLARDGFDAATGAIREICRRLADDGEVESTGTPPAYHVTD
jgi:repressor of nif and glnA expression